MTQPPRKVGRIRALLTPWLLQFGLGLGLVVGGLLGLVTDRGFFGLATVAGAVLGGGLGLYIAQSLAMPTDDS